MFKNTPLICDIFGSPYICWNIFWSISSIDKFVILWKTQWKILFMDISHIYGGYVEIEKKQAQVWANLEANSWRLMVSVLQWRVIFQIHHTIEKILWWGMITTNGQESPNDYIWRLKIKTWADIEATYVTLFCNT